LTISCLRLQCLVFLFLFDLEEEGAVDVRQNTAKGDGGANQRVEFLVASNGKLEMPGSDTLDLKVLGRVLSGSTSADGSLKGAGVWE
jgi:hypothetical protein